MELYKLKVCKKRSIYESKKQFDRFFKKEKDMFQRYKMKFIHVAYKLKVNPDFTYEWEEISRIDP